jgi:MFS family permease
MDPSKPKRSGHVKVRVRRAPSLSTEDGRQCERGTMAAVFRSRDERLLLVGVAVDAFGTGLTIPFLVVYLHGVRGIPLETIGLIVAVPAAVTLVLLGPIGWLVDRMGARRVQLCALVGAASGAWLLSSAETAGVAFVARVLSGIGSSASWPAGQALVASVVPAAERQRYFGVSFALLNFGIGIGGLVGAVFVDIARPETFATIYRVDALTFVVPLVLLAFPLRHIGAPVGRDETTGAGEDGSYRAVLVDRVYRRVLLFVFVATFVGYGQVEGGWTAYSNVVARVSPRVLGTAFAVNTAVIVLLQLVVLRFIAGRRRTRMLMLQAAIWGASWATLGLAGLAPSTGLGAGLVVGGFGLFAVGETLQSPITPAIINDVAPERLRGRYNAAAGTAFGIAAIGGPALAGFLLGSDRGGAFIATLVAGCLVLGLAARRLEEVLPAAANGLVGDTPSDGTLRRTA